MGDGFSTLGEVIKKRPLTKEGQKIFDQVGEEMEIEQLLYNLAEIRRLCEVTEVKLVKLLEKD